MEQFLIQREMRKKRSKETQVHEKTVPGIIIKKQKNFSTEGNASTCRHWHHWPDTTLPNGPHLNECANVFMLILQHEYTSKQHLLNILGLEWTIPLKEKNLIIKKQHLLS